ncbi:DUF1499 domain-containing protein [Ruegeria marina]|uniref:Uncharacterized conserved protein, DUF1499 family n=1 Tax=Ruegeria marina TaxID=639004 RepID=A0A1G6JL31_9RHOB|nr:DUF1499 domain-containing protein [Ruegeria marina]SDC19387.1 Uncharacterized conserved protein, DUF1499 family [Ruegeria marina]
MLVWFLIALVVLGLAWIRLAPSVPARWHQRPAVAADRDMQGGVLRAVATGPEGLARLDRVARATPRTRVLAGSVTEGMVTYVTRSRVFGFPDYTTAWQDGDTLRIWARLRFGGSDFGVNRDRVDQWLAAIGH